MQLIRKILSKKILSKEKKQNKNIVSSEAFKILMRHAMADRIDVETQAEPDVLDRLTKRVEETWLALGQEDPHWSVLTADKFRRDIITANIDAFFETGVESIERLESALKRVGASLLEMDNVMDFGCGVGRLSVALAQRVPSALTDSDDADKC